MKASKLSLSIFISMILLMDLLKEIELEEKIVKVPQTVLAKSKGVFNYIKYHLNSFIDQSPKDYNKPYIDSKFKDYFKFKDLKNEDLIVSIGLYNDPEDVGAGRMDTVDDILLINLAFFDPKDLEGFEDIIEHELVHAMDPKVRDQKLFGVMYAKKGAEPGGSKFSRSIDKSTPGNIKSKYTTNFEKYLKSPWEFDAFTAPLINTIKFNLNKFPNDNTYRNLLIQLLSDIKTKSIEQIVNDSKYEKLPWFFSKKEWDSKNWDTINNAYQSELYKMKAWSTKPTLYQRFTKRLGTELI
jgi:hypothetical protein